MPIRQPYQRIVYTSDILDKRYCFTIESTLESQERTGLLMISVSAGYLLSTPYNKEPKREQTFEHIRQADGSWLATSQVTLVSTRESPVDGTIVIRNPLAETVVLPIEASSKAVVLAKRPTLTVGQSTLTFPKTSPGKPGFCILTIAQQTNELPLPVTLTIDAPEQFQLACDSHPAFSPTLTLTPSPLGTYVHVRYSAGKSGIDRGQLTILSEYEEKTVQLEGHSSGFLPSIRKLSPAAGLATIRRPIQTPVTKRLPIALALIMSVGLSYTGYTNRCQIFPSLCKEEVTSLVKPQEKLSPLTLTIAAEGSEKHLPSTTESVKRAKAQENVFLERSPEKSQLLGSSTKQDKSDRRNKKETEVKNASLPSPEVGEKLTNKNTVNQANNRKTQGASIPSASDESDLERVLNQKQ